MTGRCQSAGQVFCSSAPQESCEHSSPNREAELKNQIVDGTSKVTKYSPVMSLYKPRPKGTITAIAVPAMITVPMMDAKKLTMLNSRSFGGDGASFFGYGFKFLRDTKLVMLCSDWRLTIQLSFSWSYLMSSTGSSFRDVRSVKPVSIALSPSWKDGSWTEYYGTSTHSNNLQSNRILSRSHPAISKYGVLCSISCLHSSSGSPESAGCTNLRNVEFRIKMQGWMVIKYATTRFYCQASQLLTTATLRRWFFSASLMAACCLQRSKNTMQPVVRFSMRVTEEQEAACLGSPIWWQRVGVRSNMPSHIITFNRSIPLSLNSKIPTSWLQKVTGAFWNPES